MRVYILERVYALEYSRFTTRSQRIYNGNVIIKSDIFWTRRIRKRFQRELYKVSTWKRRDEDDVKNVFNALEACKLVKNASMKIVPFLNVMVSSSSKEFRYVLIFKTVTSKTM